MCREIEHQKYSGISLDLFCLNCEQFTLVIMTPEDKAIAQIKCSACKELMVLVQVTNQRLADEMHLYGEVR